jgi:stage IV sporulation protein A
MTGVDIDGEVALIHTLKKLASQKNEMDKLSKAYQEVKERGYGVVTPDISEITLMEPELVKHGSKYGIKLRATAPSMHMIEADIVTEIAPLVGSEAQAADLITYLQESSRIDIRTQRVNAGEPGQHHD